MLDLETFGSTPGSVIVAIGAVRFGEQIDSEFYTTIDPKDAQSCGLTLDADTVKWWLSQSDEARMAIAKPPQAPTTLAFALGEFRSWIEQFGEVEVWGNGSDFDNVLLAAAYQKFHQSAPWKFWNNRCYRTMKNICPSVPIVQSGTHHNALDDAKSQAAHLMAIKRVLNL